MFLWTDIQTRTCLLELLILDFFQMQLKSLESLLVGTKVPKFLAFSSLWHMFLFTLQLIFIILKQIHHVLTGQTFNSKKKKKYFWIEFHVSLITEWLNLITDTVSLNQLPNYILFENGTEVSRYPEVNFEPKIFSAPLTKVIFCLFSSWKYKETFIHVKLSIVDLTCFLLRYLFFFMLRQMSEV